jgi:NAD(P)-dependent dehydrogenase (short-subunit alcohol dehydrogenase family)
MEITLEGKRALVTGGNMGIGRAIVEAFAASGARVAINYMAHQRAAEDLCREIGARYDRPALAIEADVSDAERIGAMFADIDEAWGGLDILVNNAGIDGPRELGWEARSEDWRHVIDVNLGGAFHCAQEALQRMVPAGSGVIINITSVHELIPWAGYSAYAASKAGLSMLTKTLAQEAASHGVRVVGLAPGAVKSPINRSIWENPEQLAALTARIPVGQLGQPEDVANMAVVLASDVASYVTGSTVFVDGGMALFPSFTNLD